MVVVRGQERMANAEQVIRSFDANDIGYTGAVLGTAPVLDGLAQSIAQCSIFTLY